MITWKTLLLAAEAAVNALPEGEIKTNLNREVEASREWLCSSKTFEYFGTIECKYSASLRLEGVKQDFDDVVKSILGKKDAKANCYLTLVVLPDPKPEAEPVATVAVEPVAA